MAAPPSPAHVRRLWHQRQLGRNRHSTGGPSARRPRFRQSPAVLADPRDPGRSPPSIQAARHRWRGETAGLGPAVSMEADASSSSNRAILGPRAARHGWRGETRRRKKRTRPRPLPVSVAPSAGLFPPSPHAHSPPSPLDHRLAISSTWPASSPHSGTFPLPRLFVREVFGPGAAVVRRQQGVEPAGPRAPQSVPVCRLGRGGTRTATLGRREAEIG